MKKINKILGLLVILFITGCSKTPGKNNNNVGYKVPDLTSFNITVNYFSSLEQEGSFTITSSTLQNMDYTLLRLNEEEVYLGISLEDIFEDKNVTIHEEAVIYAGNSYENAITIYNTISDLYILIYQNNNGPWINIPSSSGPAMLGNKNETDTSTFAENLTTINCLLII